MMQNLAKGNIGLIQEQMTRQRRDSNMGGKNINISSTKKREVKKKRGFFDL